MGDTSQCVIIAGKAGLDCNRGGPDDWPGSWGNLRFYRLSHFLSQFHFDDPLGARE